MSTDKTYEQERNEEASVRYPVTKSKLPAAWCESGKETELLIIPNGRKAFEDGADWSRDRFEKLIAEKDAEITQLREHLMKKSSMILDLNTKRQSSNEIIATLKKAMIYDKDFRGNSTSVVDRALNELAEWEKAR